MACCGRKVEPMTDGDHQALAAKTKAKNIDQELKESGYKDKLNLKILLLGSGESGKSTVLKQIKLIHKISMTPQEIRDITRSLRRNAVECMSVLVTQARTYGYDLAADDIKNHVAMFDTVDLDDADIELDHDLVAAVTALWEHETIKETYARRSEYWILEATEFYLNNIARFAEEDFEPTEEDIVMARVMTVGILQTEVPVPPLSVTLVDVGGQRSERRKWINIFDNVQAILFLVNLAGYNSVLFEDPTENRMKECLALFKQTVNSPVFANTPVILVMNKKDLLESKIRKDPITVCPCFEDYTGPKEDVTAVLEFIDRRFKDQITSGDPNRLMTFHIAARFKRDVKTCWEDVIAHLKTRYRGDINAALKGLGKEQLP
ncbi:hypothetical protein GGF32_005393 [Allomyces javanicus]|nr:hypothetical protein GGF32_005393 [Allomyces javanicus]